MIKLFVSINVGKIECSFKSSYRSKKSKEWYILHCFYNEKFYILTINWMLCFWNGGLSFKVYFENERVNVGSRDSVGTGLMFIIWLSTITFCWWLSQNSMLCFQFFSRTMRETLIPTRCVILPTFDLVMYRFQTK